MGPDRERRGHVVSLPARDQHRGEPCKSDWAGPGQSGLRERRRGRGAADVLARLSLRRDAGLGPSTWHTEGQDRMNRARVSVFATSVPRVKVHVGYNYPWAWNKSGLYFGGGSPPRSNKAMMGWVETLKPNL